MIWGYFTKYTLEVKDLSNKINTWHPDDEIISNIKKISGYSTFDGESCKWYDHEKDMRKVSLMHPTILLTLYGEGEESEDLWVKYFLNGKMQISVAKIIYAKFDEKELT